MKSKRSSPEMIDAINDLGFFLATIERRLT